MEARPRARWQGCRGAPRHLRVGADPAGASGDRVLDRARKGDLRVRPTGGSHARCRHDRGGARERPDAAPSDASDRARGPPRRRSAGGAPLPAGAGGPQGRDGAFRRCRRGQLRPAQPGGGSGEPPRARPGDFLRVHRGHRRARRTRRPGRRRERQLCQVVRRAPRRRRAPAPRLPCLRHRTDHRRRRCPRRPARSRARAGRVTRSWVAEQPRPCASRPGCYDWRVRSGARCEVLAVALAALLLAPRAVRAIPLDALDTQRAWRLGKLRFEGNHQVGSGALRDALVTRPRRWFVLWQQRPPFDPYTFRTDLDHIRVLYRSRGFYHAVVTSSVQVPEKGDVVNVTVSIEEGTPIRVTDVDLDVEGITLAAHDETLLQHLLPLEPGDVFEEARYERGRSVLRDWFRQRGYARVPVEKSARVDVRDDTATVRYRVDSGPPSVFGPVTISGLDEVDAEVVRREIAFKTGEPFQQSLLDKTRKNIDGLHLFRSVRLVEDTSRDAVVAIDIALAEAERHEVKLGVGYETEEGIRGTAGWRDYSFLGDARQLGVSVRISQLYRTIAADFLQPHFPSQTSRVRLIFLQEQTQDTTYTLNETRAMPRLEWEITPRLTTYAFYRASLNLLPQGDIKTSVRKALPQAHPSRSVASGFGFGVDLN